MRQRHTGARSQQQGEIPGDGSCDMAHDKERKEGEQQAAPFAPRDEQHSRQGGKRDNPGVHRHHHPGLGGAHRETGANVGKQRDGDEFGGVEDEGGDGERQHAQPGEAVGGGLQGGSHGE